MIDCRIKELQLLINENPDVKNRLKSDALLSAMLVIIARLEGKIYGLTKILQELDIVRNIDSLNGVDK